jgi:hypothetical protein
MEIKHGSLADYFKCFGYKRLRPVEIDPKVSNEHEFNGINKFKEILGAGKKNILCRVIYLSDDEEEIIEDKVMLTWYDARKKHSTRTEYRLYYPVSDCFTKARPGDLMFFCKNADDSFTMFIAKSGDTIANQLSLLFGIEEEAFSTTANTDTVKRDFSLDYFSNLILEKIGIEREQPSDSMLDKILETFPNGFPRTRDFSGFARSLVKDVNPFENVDKALTEWLDYEEYLFRVLEKHFVDLKLSSGFKNVDDFIDFSLSVHNRRKSRAGYALENHLKFAFTKLDIHYSSNEVTENKTKPDFIFPGIKEYRNDSFPAINLTMLGVKTTCKDRWRQILPEAKRIELKHLCTLEPGISSSQTDEMIAHKVQLVVPASIVATYNEIQRKWLITVNEFTQLVLKRQKEII